MLNNVFGIIFVVKYATKYVEYVTKYVEYVTKYVEYATLYVEYAYFPSSPTLPVKILLCTTVYQTGGISWKDFVSV